MNLDGNTSLGDLGAVASRWGQGSPCKGWIRPDGNNSGGVSLGDIGTVTSHWGQQGFICNAWTLCCTQGALCNWTTIFKDLIGEYESGNSACAHDGDPISLVIRMAADPATHLAGHGLPNDVYGQLYEENTYFDDTGACVPNELNRASDAAYETFNWPFGDCNHPVCLKARWHTRIHQSSISDPQYAALRDYAIPPHRDDVTYACGQYQFGVDGKHYVPPSGFTAARDSIKDAWIASGHHLVIEYQFWGNRDERPKCGPNGVNIIAKSDGWVVMLGLCGEVQGLAC